jgi:hypothetical protein
MLQQGIATWQILAGKVLAKQANGKNVHNTRSLHVP